MNNTARYIVKERNALWLSAQTPHLLAHEKEQGGPPIFAYQFWWSEILILMIHESHMSLVSNSLEIQVRTLGSDSLFQEAMNAVSLSLSHHLNLRPDRKAITPSVH